MQKSKNIFTRNFDYWSEKLSIEFEWIQDYVELDPWTAWDHNEELWADVLRQIFPSEFTVVTKWRILFSSWTTSPQLDILVIKPNVPSFMKQGKYYYSTCIAAVFECKRRITKWNINDFISNSIKLKSNYFIENESVHIHNLLQSPIIYWLLGESLNTRSLLDDCWVKLWDYVCDNLSKMDTNISPWYIAPDIFCVRNYGTWKADKLIDWFTEQWKINLRLMYLHFHDSWTRNPTTIFEGLLLSILSKLAWSYPDLAEHIKFLNKARPLGWHMNTRKLTFEDKKVIEIVKTKYKWYLVTQDFQENSDSH